MRRCEADPIRQRREDISLVWKNVPASRFSPASEPSSDSSSGNIGRRDCLTHDCMPGDSNQSQRSVSAQSGNFPAPVPSFSLLPRNSPVCTLRRYGGDSDRPMHRHCCDSSHTIQLRDDSSISGSDIRSLRRNGPRFPSRSASSGTATDAAKRTTRDARIHPPPRNCRAGNLFPLPRNYSSC